MNLLQVSPQHQKNSRRDYLKRNNPIYVGRVVSAMVGRVFAHKYTKRKEKVLLSNWFILSLSPTRTTCTCRGLNWHTVNLIKHTYEMSRAEKSRT